MSEPLIWVLCGVRAGDTAQALELARRVGGKVIAHRLTFNWRHYLPNWLSGAGASSLAERSRAALVPPWPDLVIATGKRTAPVALWIKQQSKGKTVVVQLGRPRMAFRYFDLIVTTPQYGLPAAENVVRINLPFAAPKMQEEAVLNHWRRQWKALPPPLIAAAIGAAKFPLRLGAAELDEYGSALGALARRENGSILLFGSPRSAAGAIERVRAQIGGSVWIADGSGPGNPYQAALSLADMFAVTGDSVSMAAEMVATGKPTHVFTLPSWPSLRWRAERGLTGSLARSGVLVAPRDVGRFVKALLASGMASDLRDMTRVQHTRQLATDQDDVVRRIRSLLERSSHGSDSLPD
jgi:mitochondrial fission protein ELM1